MDAIVVSDYPITSSLQCVCVYKKEEFHDNILIFLLS